MAKVFEPIVGQEAEEATPTNPILTEVLTLITNLKEMDFGMAVEECCNTFNNVVNECVIGKCFSWTDYQTIIDEIWTQYHLNYDFSHEDGEGYALREANGIDFD